MAASLQATTAFFGARPSRIAARRSGSPLVSRVASKVAARSRFTVSASSMEIELLDGSKTTVEVPDGESLLEAALAANIEVPYDCQLGVCMTCPAKMESGSVDQTAGMLSDDVQEKGYVLMCIAYPQGDTKIRLIDEAEILEEQLCA